MKTKLLLVAACLVAVTVGSIFAVTTLTTHTSLTPTPPPTLFLDTRYRYSSGYNFTSNTNLTLYLYNPSPALPDKTELVSYKVTTASGQSCVGNSAFKWDYNWWNPYVGMHISLGTDCSYTGQAFVFSPGTYTVIVYARWEWQTPAQAVAALTTEVHN
jgi:hypothetical protein